MSNQQTEAFLLNHHQVATSTNGNIPTVTILGSGQFITVCHEEPIRQLLKACQHALNIKEDE